MIKVEKLPVNSRYAQIVRVMQEAELRYRARERRLGAMALSAIGMFIAGGLRL